MTLFDRHQVEVFAADHSGDKTTQYNAPQWHVWLESCDKSHLPRIIVQCQRKRRRRFAGLFRMQCLHIQEALG